MDKEKLHKLQNIHRALGPRRKRHWILVGVLGVVAVLGLTLRVLALDDKIGLERNWVQADLFSGNTLMRPWFQELCRNLTGSFALSMEREYPQGDKLRTLRENSIIYMRLFEELYLRPLSDEPSSPQHKDRKRAHATLAALEDSLYPISREAIPGGIKQLYDSYRGRGIVMTSGFFHFRFTVHAIKVVRYLGCKLPIEVYYNGEDDLMPAMIEELYKMPNVFPKDLAPFIRKGAPVVEKYSNKPLAMLLSPFQEIIFMDSDSLFFQNPELMYHWASYKETGALFFRDRTLEPGQNGPLRFFKALVPNPSERARQSRFWEMTSYHEGESGALVLDKKRGGLFVLLLATMLNLDPYKTIMYEPIRGDKESFWMASEALGLPYSWGPGLGGAVGYQDPYEKGVVCGGLYHVDEDWNAFWFNGGLPRNKRFLRGQDTFNITHWALDRTGRDMHWLYETKTTPFCLLPGNPERDMGELSERDKKTALKMLQIWKELHAAHV